MHRKDETLAIAILCPAMFAGLASGVAVSAKMNERPGDAGAQAGLRSVASAAVRND